MTADAAPRRPIHARAGVGLRFPHQMEVAERSPAIPWLEVHSENYFGGGKPVAMLERLRTDYPISLHGVGLSLGSAEGLDDRHLERLAALVERIEPTLVSEHLSWSLTDGAYLADLLPLPLTEEALDAVCRNIERTQDRLKRPILVENPASYLEYRHSTMPEVEFLAGVARHTSCAILCDVNNIYVSAQNHGWDAARYLAALPAEKVGEIHLAGHSRRRFDDGAELLIDDHGSRVTTEVWQLYVEALERFGAVPTLIEWDNDIPALDVLLSEAAQADRLLERRDHADAA